MNRRTIRIYFLLIFALTPLLAAAQAKSQATLEGSWSGTLSVQGSTLKVVFNFEPKDGRIAVTIDSPDQGAKGIPANDAIVRNDSLIVESPAIMGTYKAILVSDTSMKGQWIQGGMSLPLDVNKNKKPANKPLSDNSHPLYNSKEVKIVNDKAGVTLAGTLTIPKNAKNCPAVVLVSGSGPQNRDEELMGHKPFQRIADYLSSRGIAVLRYDDRGSYESTGNFHASTSYDFADDAEAAFRFLQSYPGINPKKTGIAGHSEGGMIAPVVAARNKQVSFVILLAAPGITGKEIILTQSRAIMTSQGISRDSAERIVQFTSEIISAVESHTDDNEARQLITQTVIKQNLPESVQDSYVKSYSVYLTPWFRTFFTFDPAVYLKQLKCRVLVLNGSNDLQVLPEPNLEAIRLALQPNKKTSIHLMPGLNHLFQKSRTGLPAEYSDTSMPAMDDQVLEIIAGWIR